MNAVSKIAVLPRIVPDSFEDVQRFAKMAITSGLFKGDRKDGDAEKHAKACMAILQGLEVGLPPMQAVQSIAVINGRCLIWGDAVPGLLWANGFKIAQTISGAGEGRTATCTITRPDGTEITRAFSVADAKRARLWDERPTVKKQWEGKWEEKPNDSPWFRFPDRMLGFRALGFAVKDGASDVTRGLYVREEYEANDPVDITPPAAALDLPDIPDAITDDTGDARSAIKQAISVEMLSHIRDAYADADWPALEAEYEAKMEELRARAA